MTRTNAQPRTSTRAVIRCPACASWYCMGPTSTKREYVCVECGSVWVKPPVRETS